jgi:hypothetical protein
VRACACACVCVCARVHGCVCSRPPLSPARLSYPSQTSEPDIRVRHPSQTSESDIRVRHPSQTSESDIRVRHPSQERRGRVAADTQALRFCVSAARVCLRIATHSSGAERGDKWAIYHMHAHHVHAHHVHAHRFSSSVSLEGPGRSGHAGAAILRVRRESLNFARAC